MFLTSCYLISVYDLVYILIISFAAHTNLLPVSLYLRSVIEKQQLRRVVVRNIEDVVDTAKNSAGPQTKKPTACIC